MADTPTRAEQRILQLLADGDWHIERKLRSSFAFLQGLCLRGLLDGAMVPGKYGATPDERVWRIVRSAAGTPE